MKITLLGTGAMGKSMGEAIINSVHILTVYNRGSRSISWTHFSRDGYAILIFSCVSNS